LHHLTFRSHGGQDRAENLLTLCADCHRLRHANPSRMLGTFRGESDRGENCP
jgi:5-methylcytosine-specific restriction endonuclease McrA